MSLATVPQKGATDSRAGRPEDDECELLVRVPLDELQQQQEEATKWYVLLQALDDRTSN